MDSTELTEEEESHNLNEENSAKRFENTEQSHKLLKLLELRVAAADV